MKYLSAKEVAEKWGLSLRSVQYFCSNGRIPGAKNLGKQWIIPAGAVRPTDTRIRGARSKSNAYRFPLFIYSSAYASSDDLNPHEYALLSAQLRHLEGDYPESIGICRDILNFDVPTYIIIGAYYTIALSAMTLGNYCEYKKAVVAMEAIISSEDPHFEDYKLIIDSIKRFIGWNHRIFDNIDPSKLSLDAIYLYQYECMLGVALGRENVSKCALHVYDAFAIQVSAEGIAPLDANIRFALASLHNFVSDQSSEVHIEAACKISIAHNWNSIIAKNLQFAKTSIKKFLDNNVHGYYKKIAELSAKDFNSWRIINKQASGIYPFEVFTPSDISVLFMIYQGMTNSQICKVMGLSPKELHHALDNCCKTANVKDRNELKKYTVSQLSTWFEA